jgi:hypothetical protein
MGSNGAQVPTMHTNRKALVEKPGDNNRVSGNLLKNPRTEEPEPHASGSDDSRAGVVGLFHHAPTCGWFGSTPLQRPGGRQAPWGASFDRIPAL